MIEDPPDESLGAAMRALTPVQRRFVLAALTYPTGKDWQIAKAAGYSDRSNGSLRVEAHRQFHNPKVLEALHEEAGKRLRSSAVLGVSVLAQIARTNGHKDQFKAAEALVNRVGFGPEQKITVERTDRTGAGMVERIRQLAMLLQVDAALLLGENRPAPEMKVIEHDAARNEGDAVGSGGSDGPDGDRATVDRPDSP